MGKQLEQVCYMTVYPNSNKHVKRCSTVFLNRGMQSENHNEMSLPLTKPQERERETELSHHWWGV